MNFLKSIFQKDEFIEEVKDNQILYQTFFNKIVNKIDDSLYSGVFGGGNFELWESEVFKKEDKKLDKILKEAGKEGLSEVILSVIFIQYATADLYKRDRYKKYWVSKILKRKEIDFFPDHNAIIAQVNRFYEIS